MFKAYVIQTLSECTSFVQDLKLGHYIKVPPRATFIGELLDFLFGSVILPGGVWAFVLQRPLMMFLMRVFFPPLFPFQPSFSCEVLYSCSAFLPVCWLVDFWHVLTRCLSFTNSLVFCGVCVFRGTVQITATTLAGFVQVGVKQAMFNYIPDICQPTQKSFLTCPHNQVYFTASAVWCVFFRFFMTMPHDSSSTFTCAPQGAHRTQPSIRGPLDLQSSTIRLGRRRTPTYTLLVLATKIPESMEQVY